jgi:hypothetical protein
VVGGVGDGCDTDGVGLEVGTATPEQADIATAAIRVVALGKRIVFTFGERPWVGRILT